jgi:hypothetical protein
MKLLGLALIAIIILSIASVGATSNSKASLEQRIAVLEAQRWTTPQHAVNIVSQRVWDRATSCNLAPAYGSYGECTSKDPVLSAFNGQGNHTTYVARNISHYGEWYAAQGADGDTWTVTATMTNTEGYTCGPFTWYVWESNSYIRSANW